MFLVKNGFGPAIVRFRPDKPDKTHEALSGEMPRLRATVNRNAKHLVFLVSVMLSQFRIGPVCKASEKRVEYSRKFPDWSGAVGPAAFCFAASTVNFGYRRAGCIASGLRFAIQGIVYDMFGYCI